MNEKLKLFPFDPAKAQTVTNPDGFPVYWDDGEKAKTVCVFPSGAVAVEWEGGGTWIYKGAEGFPSLRLGPKPGKTVYLNCWRGAGCFWKDYSTEEVAREEARLGEMGGYKYTYIAIPVAGPEIEP